MDFRQKFELRRRDARWVAAVLGLVSGVAVVALALRGPDLGPAVVEARAAEPYAVRVCWVVRATRRNRRLLATYPELFASRFPGSSRGWFEALTTGSTPPPEPGLVWCDVGATRLLEWRARVHP